MLCIFCVVVDIGSFKEVVIWFGILLQVVICVIQELECLQGEMLFYCNMCQVCIISFGEVFVECVCESLCDLDGFFDMEVVSLVDEMSGLVCLVVLFVFGCSCLLFIVE